MHAEKTAARSQLRLSSAILRLRSSFLRQVKNFDIVLVSNKPGFMEKFGLGYEEMRKVNPGIIYASLTPFGVKPSKYSNKPSYDICAVAMSGINAQTGEADGAPTRIGSVIGDTSGAEGMFASTLLAYIHKLKTGRASLSIFRSCNVLHINSSTFADTQPHGSYSGRSGNHNANLCPYGIYTGKTMSMVIGAVSPATWNALCDCMGHPEYKGRSALCDNARSLQASHPRRADHHRLINTFDDSQRSLISSMQPGALLPGAHARGSMGRRGIQPPRLVGQLPDVSRVGGNRCCIEQALRVLCRFLGCQRRRSPSAARSPHRRETATRSSKAGARAKRKQRLCSSSGARRTSDNFKHADGRHLPAIGYLKMRQGEAMEKRNFIIPEFGPLADSGVIGAGSLIAMPLCGNNDGGFQGEVIQIERPKIGDTYRSFPPLKKTEQGTAGHRGCRDARNRLSMTLELDLNDPDVKEIFFRLIERSDIFIENMVWLDKLGIHDSELLKINPRLVIVHVSGYGHKEFGGLPEICDQASYDMTSQAYSGYALFNGYPDRGSAYSQAPRSATI